MQTHQPVVDSGVGRAGELDHVHLHPRRREIFVKRGDQFLRLVIIERAVNQVHPDDAERLLLLDVGFIEHPHVDDDLARLAPRLRLETNPEPAVRFVMLLETARRDRVGENKKSALVADLLVEPLDQQIVFVIEHRPEPGAADVALGRAVNRVAKLHVVSRHRLRDRAGGAADVEKTPRHFLSGADLGKGAVLFLVEIDLERLLVRPDIHLRVHASKMDSADGQGKFRRCLSAVAASLCEARVLAMSVVRDRLQLDTRDLHRAAATAAPRSALFAGIQPRRSLGKAA